MRGRARAGVGERRHTNNKIQKVEKDDEETEQKETEGSDSEIEILNHPETDEARKD